MALALCITSASATAYAHEPLGPGDLAVVGIRQGSPDVVVVLTFVQLHDGDTIALTDDGMMNDGTLRRAEGTTFFEVVRTIVPRGATFEVPVGTMSLDRSADQVFVYRGTVDASGTLAGAWIWALGWGVPFGSDATSTRDSALPWPLATQFTELATGAADMAYVGMTSGTESELRTAIADATNWRVGPAGTLAFAAAFEVRTDRGGPCSLDTDCALATFCVDGTCCDTTCGRETAGHCFGCYFAIGDPRNGTCGPAATTQLCRIGRGSCDSQETCDGVSTSCPADSLAAAGTVCRTPRGPCDASEVCDGATNVCPPDRLAAIGHVCRAPRDSCDVAESCTGSTAGCPLDLSSADGTICRSRCGDAVCSMGVCGVCPDDDAGALSDASGSEDAATLVLDAGRPDATVVRDASPRQADASFDGGGDDAVSPDAASEVGVREPDSSPRDSSPRDSSAGDAGPPPPARGSCSCRAGSARSIPIVGPLLLGWWWWARRSRPKARPRRPV